MILVPAKEFRSRAAKIFAAAGASSSEALIVADSLVEASLAGVDSHGVVRIPEYVGRMLGIPGYGPMTKLKPKAKIKIIKDASAITVVDGNWGFGQVVARKAMDLAIKKAKRYNVGIVTGRNCDHIGRLAEYPLMAAAQNMIGAVFCKTIPVMSPVGAKGRIIGNNPISFAIPAGKERPIVTDIAMSVVAGGKVTMASEKGERIPEGWLLDAAGNPATDPKAWLERGSLVPVGGHKGYAMSVVTEVLGGVLSGAGTLLDYSGNNAFLAMAINVRAFMPLSKFKEGVDKFISDLRAAPKATGAKEILIPGEPEIREKERRLKSGVPVPEKTLNEIRDIAKRLNVQIKI